MARATVCFLLVVAGGVGVLNAQSSRPNIVFVLVDDMGYADLGCMGGKDIKTPNIDRLASEGLKFTDFYANAPVCTPTRAAFMTGRWQQRVGLEWATGYSAEQYRRQGDKWVEEPDKLALGLPDGETTIAQMLKAAGYATGCFGKWHLGYRPEFNPIRRGFDEYFGNLLGHSDFYRYVYWDGTYQLREGEQPVKAEGYLTDLINERATRFIREHAGQPFFLYVPYNAVHWPFQPPNRPLPELTKGNAHDGTRRDYAAMLERIDDGVGMMLKELEKQGALDNTLFVLSSDNGGERLSDNSPLFHHKQTLYEGGIRVPCLMRWPARLPRGKVVNQPAITMDLTATFLGAANVAGTLGVPSADNGTRSVPTTDRQLDGIDLLPILTRAAPERERTFCWRVNRSSRKAKAIRHGDWKYIDDGGVELLINLKDDIGERRDLGFQRPDVLKDLQSRLKAWEEEMDRSNPAFVVR